MASPAWRAPLAAALLLLATPLLAGCVGTAAASAMDAKSPADEAAQAWDVDAQLAQVIGAEGTFPLSAAAPYFGADTSGQDFSEAEQDEDVGDGLSQIWLYRYVSPNRDDAYVVVVVEGEVVRAETDERQEEDAAVGPWTLDSDEAMALALEANEGLRKGTESENYGIMSVLSRDEGENARWFIAGGGGGSAGGGGGFVLIDAETGEVIESSGGFRRY